MTHLEAMTQVCWLQNTYSNQYSEEMSENEINTLIEQMVIDFRGYSGAEVMNAFVAIGKGRKASPTNAEVVAYLKKSNVSKADPLEQAISQQIIKSYEKPDEIVYRNGVPGRMLHRDAIRHFLEDYAVGCTKGGSEYYYKNYPKVEFVPIGADLRSV